jgi:hypothetical protein
VSHARLAPLAACLALLSVGNAFAQANLIQNGSFETGDFSSWVQSGNTQFTSVMNQAYGGVAAEDGNDYALLGPVGTDGVLSQSFADHAGQSLQVSFWLASDGNIPNDFTASFDGAALVSLSNTGPFGWTEYDANVTGTGEDILSFAFRDDPGYLSLDNIVVAPGSPIPEPASLALLPLGLLALIRLRRAA